MSLTSQWVDKVDNVDTVKASDVNMIAAAVKTLEVSATVAPKIGVNGTWMIWSPATSVFVDTGIKAIGVDGAKGDKGEPGHGLIIKDIYDNYAALVAAFPTGNDNIYQTADTDNLYIWSAMRNQWTTLGNISPVTSAGTTTYDHNNTKLTAANVQDAIDQLANLIESGVTITPTINLGMNSVIRKADNIESIPKFTIQGKSYINLLGKDGNCEDVSKWNTRQSTLTLDTSKKVFGANAIKLTISATGGNMYKYLNTVNFDASKYYMFSAYLDKGNATDIYIVKNTTGGGVHKIAISTSITPTRIMFKLQPSDNNVGNVFSIGVDGTNGQYAYVDGVMINEITADEYNNLTTDQLLEKYPYVDSYACLQNPYIEVRHDNLVRNGNGEEGVGYWINRNTDSVLQIENGRFKADNVVQWTGYIQIIKVKKNTKYFTTGNLTGFALQIYNTSVTTWLGRTGGYFNTGDNEEVTILIQNVQSSPITGYFDHIHIVEGTTAPTSYKPCRIERCVIEGKFTSDDTFTYENGEVSGLLNWKHKTLYGKDYDWIYQDDYTGFKRMQCTNPPNTLGGIVGHKMVKYDGKICTESSGVETNDIFACWTNNVTYISVSDTDTGWAETIQPNADEVKAFMNGWKAIYTTANRYICWVSVLDKTPPSGAVYSELIAQSNSGATTMTIADGTKFVVNDYVNVYDKTTGNVWFYQIIAISGNVITLNGGNTQVFTIGSYMIKCDVVGVNTSMLTYCKNNIAPNYEGYQLHYKLANPEPITDVNTHIHGDIPKFDEGDNYLYLDSGIVLGEVVTPYSDGTNAHINIFNYSTFPNTSVTKNKVETFYGIYKNSVYDTKYIIEIDNTYAYGKYRAYTATANFDSNATYTVDYQILKTMHTTPMSITASYQQDIVNAIVDLAESVESRQSHDSALDALVDLSVYEKVTFGINGKTGVYITPIKLSSAVGLLIELPFKVTKKTIPVVNMSDLILYRGYDNTLVTNIFSLYRISMDKDKCILEFTSSNSIDIAQWYYGYYGSVTVTADCRGRLA